MIRFVLLLELMTLLYSTFLLHAAHRRDLPRDLQWAGAGLLSVVMATAIGVGVNISVNQALSPGAVVLGVLIIPPTLSSLWLAVRVVRHR